jgi:bifunctional DNA-binding transcriptional regulator/antitoxin component of YhaV-PrlF toxin-antitoxin module
MRAAKDVSVNGIPRTYRRRPPNCYREGEGARASAIIGMTVVLKPKSEIVVPRSVRRKAGFKSGDRLEFKAAGGVITIVPKLPAADEYTPAQRSAIDRGIAQSEKDYRAGRFHGPFETHEEFIASLHKEAAKLRVKKPKRAAK